MLAARLHDYTTEMSQGLELDEVERPEATQSDHVVIDVKGAGWCQTDNHIIEGMWTDYVDQDLPMTLGHENAGVVAETGSEVSIVDVGDEVICHPVMTCGTCRSCRKGEDMYCENLQFPGLNTDGGFAEFLRTNERAVIPLSANIDPVEIAPHADAGITAYHASKKAAKDLDPGDYAVIIGIGGLGHIGLQTLDAMTAAEIIAIDIKAEALALADELGADYTLNSRSEDVIDEVSGITNGTGASQILDFVGADDTTAYSPDIIASGGDHHIIGYGGDINTPSQGLVNEEFSYVGTLVGQYTELQELMALVEQGDVSLRTTKFKFDEINTVAERLEERDIEGRAVILPPS
ncbi:MAG: NAD(P)-dependent alcohol dehydrogenase [Halobacteriaceae archaeon]